MDSEGLLNFIENIDSYDLGEYKDDFIKKAYESAVATIGEPEFHMDAIADSMCTYLEGARDMYLKLKEKPK